MNKYFYLFFLVLIVMLTSFSLVSAAEFDNIKRYDLEVGDYGKITIRNSVLGIPFLQLDKVIELELKENSDRCVGFGCYAEKEIVLYEDGVLISDIRFLHIEKNGIQYYDNLKYKLKIKTDEQKTVDDYEHKCFDGKYIDPIYDEVNKTWIDGYYKRICRDIKVGSHQEIVWDEYNIGDETNAGTYYVRLEGTLPDIFTTIDWQIKSNGYWLDEWATWTSGLNNNLLAYWNMTNTSANKIIDLTGNGYDADVINFNGNLTEIDGLIGKAQHAINWSTGADSGDIGRGEGNHINITNSAPNFTSLNNNFSINMWYNGSQEVTSARRPILSLGGEEGMGIMLTTTKFGVTHENQIDLTPAHSSDVIDNSWHMLTTVVQPNGSIQMWVDGVIENVSATLPRTFAGTRHTTIGASTDRFREVNGTLDEIGIWNRTLTSAEIIQLYNSGAGLIFNESQTQITLNFPNDSSVFLAGEMTFNGTVDVLIDNNITNATLYIWNSTNNVNFTTNFTIETNDLSLNNYNLSANLLIIDGYTWNFFACSNISVGDPCDWASQNRTFNISNLLETAQSFNNETTEGATEAFSINLTKSPSIQISTISLIYNGTPNSFAYSINGNEVFSEGSITIPAIDTATNLSFFWSITLDDDSILNTTETNQSVLTVGMDNCSSFSNLIYNFTQFDEGDKTQLGTNNTIEIEVNIYDLTKTLLLVNFSQKFIDTNPAQICFENSLLETVNYSSYVTVKYFANSTTTNESYSIEYHNILNQTIGNSTVPKHIPLYNLKEIDTTKFRLNFRDSSYNLAPNILVNIYRKYIEDNDFKLVEIPLTDSNGQTMLNLVRNDIIYNFIMINEGGQIIATFNELRAFCQDFTIGDCVINLAANSTSEPAYDYNEEFALSISLPVYNNVTERVSINFITDDLTPTTVRMDVFRNNQFGNRSVCTNSLTAASGTLSCDVSEIVDTDQFLFIYIYVEDSLASTYTINLSASTLNFGKSNGAFYAFLLILIIITLFMEDKKVLVIALGLGWVACLSLGLISGLLIGAVSSGIWILVTIAIYIWKLNKEDLL